jgi:hypothetical protein
VSTFEFDDFQFGPTPAAEFTPEAISLPMLDALPSVSRATSNPFLFLIFGAVLAIVAVVLRVRAAR